MDLNCAVNSAGHRPALCAALHMSYNDIQVISKDLQIPFLDPEIQRMSGCDALKWFCRDCARNWWTIPKMEGGSAIIWHRGRHETDELMGAVQRWYLLMLPHSASGLAEGQISAAGIDTSQLKIRVSRCEFNEWIARAEVAQRGLCDPALIAEALNL